MKRCMGCMAEMEEQYTICPTCGYSEGTPPREAYHMEPGTILAGRYIAGRVLGFGGFGVTYIGWDEQLYRKVAIKEFLPSSFATRMPGYTEISVYGGEAGEQFHAGLERFVEEARRLAKFNGIPGIVDIYDTFIENNTAYIVMEYLQGQDVKKKLEQDGVFSYEEAGEIILRVCETLKPVHQAGIIHRDISPDNIYLTDGGEVKLLDFGASRYATGVNSKSLSVILKAGYAPEEQYRSRGNQGSWSDVYALAATFYKMITGVTPPDSMERAILDELEEPSKLGVQLPKDGENAILNALNIRKENRTQTVEEFACQLSAGKVERVKEKMTREDTGKLPLWGKIFIGGGISLTLLFGLLTATGVVDFGQGNLLADQFGSGVEEGYVNAPGLVNQMEADAQRMVKKAGLDYLIVGKEYSDQIAKGKILGQEPLPGRVIALGEMMEVTISGGSRQEAVEAGEVEMPDVTFMDIREAMYTMEESGFHYYSNYEFSDTVAEGLVIRYEPYNEGRGAELIVSAGRKGQKGTFGEVRAPYYDASWSDIRFAVTVDEMLGEKIRVTHEIQYTEDQGNTWKNLKGMNGDTWEDYSRYYMDEEHEPIANERISLAELIAFANPELVGRELQFRVVRYGSTDNIRSEDSLDETVIPGTVTVTVEGDEVKVTDFEMLDWETVKRMNEQKKWAEHHSFTYGLENEETMKYEQPICLKGDFKKDTSYEIFFDSRNIGSMRRWESCDEEGVLYLPVGQHELESHMELDLTFHVIEAPDSWMKNSQHAEVELNKPSTRALKKGVVTETSVGKPFLTSAGIDLHKESYMEIRFESSTQAPGTILREQLGNDPFYILSAGEVTEQTREGQVMATILSPQSYEQLITACIYFTDGYGTSGTPQVLYSLDGGDSYQMLTDRQGNQIDYYSSRGNHEATQLYCVDYTKATRWLLQERTDLWEKELLLAIDDGDPVPVRETLMIRNDIPPVSISSVEDISLASLEQYYQEGRIAPDSFTDSMRRNYASGHAEDAKSFCLSGNFEAGKTYYIMPGGERYSYQPFPCVRDGELMFGFWNSPEIDAKTRELYRNSIAQSVTYEYVPDREQVIAHVSQPVTVNLEQMLD